MLQLTGKYERDEVWGNFEVKLGSKQWPSDDPNDSPFDQFVCKLCGKSFSLQTNGGFYVGESKPGEDNLIILAEHMNIKH